MLVHFRSKYSANFFLLERDAKPLFELMGKTISAKGIISQESAAEVLATLQHGLANTAAPVSTAASQLDHDENGHADSTSPVVGLSTRSWPLREMLQIAATKGGDVMWETASS